MTKQTKIKIRKAVTFIRTLFFILFGICLALTIATADGSSILFSVVCFVIGTVCFGISYYLDQLLVETHWKGDKPSLFNK